MAPGPLWRGVLPPTWCRDPPRLELILPTGTVTGHARPQEPRLGWFIVSRETRSDPAARPGEKCRKYGGLTTLAATPDDSDTDPKLGRAVLSLVKQRSTQSHRDQRVIAIANQKGGVGKTTTAVNLAAALGDFGQRVLVLDMDPQGNASSGLGVSANEQPRGIYEVITGDATASEAILPTVAPGVDLIPSGQRLIGAEVELVPQPDRERILGRQLEPIRERYDFLLADCPPSLGLITVNTLAAAQSVLIPIQCEYYALEGLTQLLNAIRLVQQSLNPKLEIEGIVLTMFDSRLNLSQEVANEARKFFQGKVLDTVVPRNVRLSEAPSFGQPVIQYDHGCIGSQSYLNLAKELLAREAVGVPHE